MPPLKWLLGTLLQNLFFHLCVSFFISFQIKSKGKNLFLKIKTILLKNGICATDKSYKQQDWKGCEVPTTAWRLPDDCLTTAWRLPDDCLTTAWRLLDDCLTTAWRLLEDCRMTAWPLPNDCLMTVWQFEMGNHRDNDEKYRLILINLNLLTQIKWEENSLSQTFSVQLKTFVTGPLEVLFFFDMERFITTTKV